MAGEIQLNSTTFATESGGTVTVSNVDSATNRQNLGLEIGVDVQQFDADTTKNDVANTFTANQIILVTDNTNAALRVTQLGTGNALVVEDETNPDSTPFIVDASGNVGIGTSSPSEKLHVVGNISVGDGHFIGNGSGDNLEIVSGSAENILLKSSGGVITFGSTTDERMRIDSSGNVDVNGHISNGITNSTYISGERGVEAFAGSVDDKTYIYGRNVADSSGVFRCEIGNNTKIQLTGEGNGYFDGTGDLGPADYAEYFEWLDGNPNNDDRRGYPVVLESGKIRIATSSDNAEDIIGIISARPAIVGDTASLGWQGKFATDEFGERLKRPITVYSWTDANGNELQYRQDSIPEDVTVPDDANSDIRYEDFYSDEYDPTVEYLPRTERPEWSPVGLLGKLRMRTGQPTGTRWIKLRDISETIELWFIR